MSDDVEQRDENETDLISDAEVLAEVKRWGLGEAEWCLLMLVDKYGPLRAAHLDLLVGEACGERIRRLIEAEFLIRLEIGRGWGQALLLADYGRVWLPLYKRRKRIPNDLVSRYTRFGNWLHHDTKVADFMVSLLAETELLAGQVDWFTPRRHPDREGYRVVRWDACGRFSLFGRSFGFVLEADCSSEENPKFAEKVYRYQEYLDDFDWQGVVAYGEVLPILVVTTGGETRLQNMKRAVNEVLVEVEGSAVQQWWFTTYDRLAADPLRNPLYAPVWEQGWSVAAPVLYYKDNLQATSSYLHKLASNYDELLAGEREAATKKLQRLRSALPLLVERLIKQ